MSTTIAIGAHVDPTHRPEAFVALIQRLLTRSYWVNALTHDKRWSHGLKAVAPDLSAPELLALARSITASDQALECEIAYQLTPQRTIAISVFLCGTQFLSGKEVLLNGPIRLSMGHNELARPLYNIPPEQRTREELTRLGMETLQDAEFLFFHVCGVLEKSETADRLEHAAMYQESGWPSPAQAGMVFHRQAREFARDFLRIYAEYHWQVPIPTTLGRNR
ncbi:MAG TPA: hypothetical protein VKY74_21490, partial [Chloroflexia bacterium]|nr:hypothetical protein [Chloroflexia bacterium]